MNIYAATGHRPEKLGGYGEAQENKLRNLAIWYMQQTRPDQCISGMALGWDMAWAEAALEMEIPLIAAVPFHGQERKWPYESQLRYESIVARAADVIVVCDGGYAPWKMQKRNQWMVNNSTALIALWDGSPGGTGNCMKYADIINHPTANLWQYFMPPGVTLN